MQSATDIAFVLLGFLCLHFAENQAEDAHVNSNLLDIRVPREYSKVSRHPRRSLFSFP